MLNMKINQIQKLTTFSSWYNCSADSLRKV